MRALIILLAFILSCESEALSRAQLHLSCNTIMSKNKISMMHFQGLKRFGTKVGRNIRWRSASALQISQIAFASIAPRSMSVVLRARRGVGSRLGSNSMLIKMIWPDSVWLRFCLVFSMMFMFLGKWLGVKVPFILQRAIDSAATAALSAAGAKEKAAAASAGMSKAALAILLYGMSRAAAVIFAEIKTCLFAHVSQNALRKFANEIFSHLHKLDSEFHLSTPSGVVSVAYVRAIRGFQTMLFQIVFSVFPAVLELSLVSMVLYKRFGPTFSALTIITFTAYLLFTIWITEWRVKLRKELVDVDNSRNGFFIDSILNHEVVKLFTNEKKEAAKFDSYLWRIQALSIESTYAIAVLNFGQAIMFSAGLTSSLYLALQQVARGAMSVGDLVAVNAMLLQLSLPFNFMGYTYQELRQALVDTEYMRKVLNDFYTSPVKDVADAADFDSLAVRAGPSSLEFKDVVFTYSIAPPANTSAVGGGEFAEGAIALPTLNPNKTSPLLRGISFRVEPGQNVAIVGPSGSGKSTVLRLITRMLEPTGGQVLIDEVDVRQATLRSLRTRVAVVPQDTSLFDETVEYNILYGSDIGPQDARTAAQQQALNDVLRRCNLEATVAKLESGLSTRVGERGARLSGGERQKVSIARALLRDPSLILCDEVTSAVDAFAERDIVDTLRNATAHRTTLTVAHRLSSIVHCDGIIVMDKGQIVEQGTHQDLLALNGVYSRMWRAQNGEAEKQQQQQLHLLGIHNNGVTGGPANTAVLLETERVECVGGAVTPPVNLPAPRALPDAYAQHLNVGLAGQLARGLLVPSRKVPRFTAVSPVVLIDPVGGPASVSASEQSEEEDGLGSDYDDNADGDPRVSVAPAQSADMASS